MDNRFFDIREELSKLDFFLQYLQGLVRGNKVRYYTIVPKIGMVIFWTKPEEDTVLVFTHEGEEIKYRLNKVETFPNDWEVVVTRWLKSCNPNDFVLDGMENSPESFLSDVTLKPGFRMRCENWGHVGKSSYGLALITPVWSWYGK